MSPKFKVKLKSVHKRSGLSYYRVAKDTGLPMNTVIRYAKHDPVVSRLENTFIILCDYYGVDWRDPAVVEVIEEDRPEFEAPALEMA
jgi:hypothetical protein